MLESTDGQVIPGLNYQIDRFSASLSLLSSLDLWPFRYTSSFDLVPGKEELPAEHPDFYEHCMDSGGFPGHDNEAGEEILTQIYRVFGGVVLPIL